MSDKKLVVITGASSGIGAATAKAFSDAGYPLLLLARRLDRMQALNLPNAIIKEVDVLDLDAMKAAINEAQDSYGEVDCLVNNAGILRDRTFLKMTDEEFDDVWRVHVKGTFWCSQAACKIMKERNTGGSIINTTSGAHFGNFGQTNIFFDD